MFSDDSDSQPSSGDDDDDDPSMHSKKKQKTTKATATAKQQTNKSQGKQRAAPAAAADDDDDVGVQVTGTAKGGLANITPESMTRLEAARIIFAEPKVCEIAVCAPPPIWSLTPA